MGFWEQILLNLDYIPLLQAVDKFIGTYLG